VCTAPLASGGVPNPPDDVLQPPGIDFIRFFKYQFMGDLMYI
jgi:hypothetical protein